MRVTPVTTPKKSLFPGSFGSLILGRDLEKLKENSTFLSLGGSGPDLEGACLGGASLGASERGNDYINSLAPGRFERNLRKVIFKLILMIGGWGIFCKMTLKLMSMGLTDDKSTLVQVMAWCLTAPSHYLNQCWPRSMSPYGITRPQWVNLLVPGKQHCSNFKSIIFKFRLRIDIFHFL